MMSQDIDAITTQDVRTTILNFLQQRLIHNSAYKSASNKLAKANVDNTINAINEANQHLAKLTQHFEFENWMEDALARRISWLIIATHLSKGIHPSSKASNVNYNTQKKPLSHVWVSSSTINGLPYDATGSAAALDIFGLLNQKVNNQVSLLQLVVQNHPSLKTAFSDNQQKSELYLANLKMLLIDNWDNPQSSGLNKQIYWPNADNPYLSAKCNQYHLLIPLYPSSLCHVVYQKVQERFSEHNKLAREQRNKKTEEQHCYFSFKDLAVVRLGGSNAQNTSQLIGRQMGRNFLLPSLPPHMAEKRPLRITKKQSTIFSNSMKYHCRNGFDELYAVIEAQKNTKQIRDKRKKEAFGNILGQLFNSVKQIQQHFPAGWSKNYQLDMNQKCWLDPKRGNLDSEEAFAMLRDKGDWLIEIEKQFSRWIAAILKDKFNHIATYFDDAEIIEWQREFSEVVKASQRNCEGCI